MSPIVAAFVFALFGMSIGSMLNVCIDRIPAGQSIVSPPSHCPSCNRKIAGIDLIPVFSYIFLRGRCRYCGAGIPVRILIVELSTALLFGFIAWHFMSYHGGLSALVAVPLFYACIFTVIFFIDLERQIVIVHPIVSTGIALAIIFSLFWDGFGDYWPQSGIANTYLDGMTSALLGGAAGLIFMIVPYFIARWHYKSEGIGQGDIYLGVLIGAATGFPLVFVALITGIVIGGITAIALLALRRKKKRDMIPFGPFLSLGAMTAVIWGTQIMDRYLGNYSSF